jgi:hypothetical protein
VDADHVLRAAVQDVAEMLGQLLQKSSVDSLVHPDCQALQLLNTATLGAQAAFGNRFGRPHQVAAVGLLRLPDVVQQVG